MATETQIANLKRLLATLRPENIAIAEQLAIALGLADWQLRELRVSCAAPYFIFTLGYRTDRLCNRVATQVNQVGTPVCDNCAHWHAFYEPKRGLGNS